MKKETKKQKHQFKPFKLHPIFAGPKTFGQKTADKVTTWAGSWTFIILFLIFMFIWMLFNGYYLVKYSQKESFDPYPFILLNLVLSCLAALQAPIILMSQNRQTQRDRLKAAFDYRINRKAEREIREIKNILLNEQKRKSNFKK